jgi:uncharacterized protein
VPILRLLPETYRQMPWRNGLGVTTEVARRPESSESFDWRVSVATVASDGPFSSFPGYDRVIVAIRGNGMTLCHPEPGTTVTLDLLQPYAFAGDWKTTCALRNGPILDFGVIARRSAFRPRVTILHLSEARDCVLSPVSLVYALEGAATLHASGERAAVDAGESLLIDQAATIPSGALLMPGPSGAILLCVSLQATGESASTGL